MAGNRFRKTDWENAEGLTRKGKNGRKSRKKRTEKMTKN